LKVEEVLKSDEVTKRKEKAWNVGFNIKNNTSALR
jgi:hypothetical protein